MLQLSQLRPLLLHRYVFKEFLPPFLVGLLIFTFILILNNLFLMMDLFLNRGVSLWLILKMAGLILPMFLPLSVPMAALLASFIAYGRLSEDGEITALKSSGCSLKQYCFPNLIASLVLSGLLVFFNLSAAPRAARAFKDLYFAVAQQNPLALFSAKVMNHFGEYKVIVEKMDRQKKKMSGISIYKMNRLGPPTRILAPEGEIDSFPGEGITLELFNGSVHQPDPEKELGYTITKFNRFALKIPAKVESDKKSYSVREMTYVELKNKIKEQITELDAAPYRTENHLRIAIAFAPFVFTILGVAIGSRVRRGSKSVGIGGSIIVLLIYYGLLMFVVSLASQNVFSPMILTWVPNAVILAAGLGLWHRLAKQ